MKNFIVRCLVTACLTVATFAQPATSNTDQAEAEKAKQDNEKKALVLLDAIITEAQSLKLPENRAYVLALAADALWTKDETRARTLFQEAAATLTQILNSIESDDPNYHNRMQFPAQLRYQMLQMTVHRDAQLALDILRATRPTKAPEREPNTLDPEAQMESQLATQVVQKDPKRAAQIAEESLEKGVSDGVWDAISRLQAKDPDAAQRLAGKLLTKLKNEDLTQNYQAVNVASNVMFALNNQVQAPPTNQPSLLSEQAQKEFVATMVAAALKASDNAAQQLANTLQQTMPLVEKYAPTQALVLRRKFPPHPTIVPSNKPYEEFSQLQQKGTVEQLLAFAKTAPSNLSSEAYQQAANKALGQGESERARTIITTNVPASQRRWMLENLDQSLLTNTFNAGKSEEVRRILDRLPVSEYKTTQLLILAERLLQKGDKTTAMQYLEEARQSINPRVETYNQFHAHLRLLNLLTRVDAEHSAEMLARLVPRLNALLAAAEVLDGFEQRNGFQNNELRLQGEGGMMIQVLRQFAETLATVASSDFEGAKAVTDQFERSEMRLLLRLLLAQTTLRNPSVGLVPIPRGILTPLPPRPR